jgi:hypothetical protein
LIWLIISEEDDYQANEKAGGGKPDGGDSQGTPQSSRSRSRTKAGITGRQWSQMAYYQSQSSRSRDCQMGVKQQAIGSPQPRFQHTALRDQSFEAFRYKTPIDDTEKRGDIFRPTVLIFQIIGVFPHVNAEQRLLALADR